MNGSVPAPPVGPVPLDRVPPTITSRSEFQSALRWGVRAAIAHDARQMWWVSRDFADWPLDELELLAELTPWLRRPLRRLVLLAASYTAMPQAHPRFVAWRRQWAHAIDACAPPAELADSLPTLFVDDGGVCIQLLDKVNWRGRVELDPRAALAWRGQIDVVLQRSELAFPVSQLGL